MSNPPRLLAPLLAASLGLTALPTTALACGGFFCQITPVEQNAERVLFEVDPSTGVLTTTVEIRYVGAPEGFSWVVPVPETPELLDVPVGALQVLDAATVPQIIAPPTTCSGMPGGMNRGTASPAMAEDDAGGGGVNVEDLPQVGPYDPEVVSSDDPAALIEWLNTNGYLITEPMEPYVADYVASGMKFLAMKLAPGSDVADVSPISMQWSGAEPMVPISLTSVSAEPEMGVMVFVAAAGRYESSNFTNLEVDVADVQADPRNGANNYYPLLSWLLDEAGGQAIVTEYADTAAITAQNLDNVFTQFTEDAESREWVGEVLGRRAYVTRMYTRLSGWEMTRDPSFGPAASDATVDRILDLSDRPAVEVCGPDESEPEPCGQTYCGEDALCATTDAGIDGCVCPEGATARVISEPSSPGGFLRDTVVCQKTELEFMDAILGTELGPADPCATLPPDAFGTCVPVNGFATLRCDEGFAAVPDGVGGAVCARVQKTYEADQLLWNSGCGGSGCSAGATVGSASWLLLLLAPLLRRRRR